MGLNLTVFGLMAAKEVSGHGVGGDALMAPARSSEKDLKLEQVGFEATGLATTILSDSLISIFNKFIDAAIFCYSRCTTEKKMHKLETSVIL